MLWSRHGWNRGQAACAHFARTRLGLLERSFESVWRAARWRCDFDQRWQGSDVGKCDLEFKIGTTVNGPPDHETGSICSRTSARSRAEPSASRALSTADAICESLGAKILIERDDAVVRRAEGLELVSAVLRGIAIETDLEICGVKFRIDPLKAQKTGFYLDQVPHYAAVAGLAPGRRVLDCFSNQGAFALVCARAGASEIIGVEIQASAIEGARENSKDNQLPIRRVEQDVFEYLRAAEKAGAEFDLIIVDPPSFTKTKSRVHDAIRGYRELHLRAFKLLSRDGLLATFSCSHHVTDAIFASTISDALVDARKSARRLRRFEQALDHPVLPNLPETEYFKGTLIEMMPGR